MVVGTLVYVARASFFVRMVRSGSLDLALGYLRVASFYGSLYSSGASVGSYYLEFDTSIVRPSNNLGVRYGGFSLRCLQHKHFRPSRNYEHLQVSELHRLG